MYTIEQLVELARKSSPFYKELYHNVPEKGWKITDLPMVDLEAFREANVFANNRLITEELGEAVIIKTGGTTGKTKLSFYKNSELREICEYLSFKNEGNGMADGDRIATMLPAGNLYGSYLFSSLVLHYARNRFAVFHFGFDTAFDELASFLKEFRINCIISLPTYIRQFVEYINVNKLQEGFSIRKVYYFGETMFHDVRDEVIRTFPGCTIHSSGYSSVDGALIGYVDLGCGFNEHRAPDGMTIVELIDEDTNEVIEETGKPGKIYITNLARGLMPIIRYPSGDMGKWMEPQGSPNRKFMLLGRAGEGVRLYGPIFYFNDVANLLFPFYESHGLLNFQMIASRDQKMECLEIRVALKERRSDEIELEALLREKLEKKYTWAVQNMKDGLMLPFVISFVSMNELETNLRTGKLLRVIDRRLDGIA
jgi:phenylacetate-CoA ligase